MALDFEFYDPEAFCSIPKFGCAKIVEEAPPGGPQPRNPSDPTHPFNDPAFPCNSNEKAVALIDVNGEPDAFNVSNLTKTTVSRLGLNNQYVPGFLVNFIDNPEGITYTRFFALNEGAAFPASSIPPIDCGIGGGGGGGGGGSDPIVPYNPYNDTITVRATIIDCGGGSQDVVDCTRVNRWNTIYQRAITDDGSRNMMADWNAGPFRITSRSYTGSTDFTLQNAVREASLTMQDNGSGDSEFVMPSLTIDGMRDGQRFSSELRVWGGDSGYTTISDNTLQTTVGDLNIMVPSESTALGGTAKKINFGDATTNNSYSTIDMSTLTQSLSSNAKIDALNPGTQINAGAPGGLVIPYIKNSQMAGVQKKLGMIWIDYENSLMKVSFEQTLSTFTEGVIVSEPTVSIQPSNKVLMFTEGLIVSSPGTLNHNVYPGGEILHSFTIG